MSCKTQGLEMKTCHVLKCLYLFHLLSQGYKKIQINQDGKTDIWLISFLCCGHELTQRPGDQIGTFRYYKVNSIPCEKVVNSTLPEFKQSKTLNTLSSLYTSVWPPFHSSFAIVFVQVLSHD